MPFGLKNAPATFQRLMDLVLTGLQGIELFVYLDDIVLYANTLEEHEEKFTKLANRLREANLKLQPDKCEFLRPEVVYLGHVIDKEGVRPDTKKLEAYQEANQENKIQKHTRIMQKKINTLQKLSRQKNQKNNQEIYIQKLKSEVDHVWLCSINIRKIPESSKDDDKNYNSSTSVSNEDEEGQYQEEYQAEDAEEGYREDNEDEENDNGENLEEDSCDEENHNFKKQNKELQDDLEYLKAIDSVDNRPPPEPPPIEIPVFTTFISNKNIVECRDKMCMRKDNYVYFTTTEGEPRDFGSSILEKRQQLPKFTKFQKGLAKEILKVRVKAKSPMVITDTPGTAFEKIAMDIVGPLPKTTSGNINILTIQDNFTKYLLAIALPNQKASTILDAFIKRFICIYGSPKGVLTDQGKNFLSNLLRRLAKRFRKRQFKTSDFHPQSNGSLERSHHSLSEYLKQFVNKNSEWDEWLELATFSYNTSVHEGTKCTPYELVFGKISRQPSSEPPPPHEKLETYDDYTIKLVTRLHEMRAVAR
ncbi:uncharacterized protein K02A2.6-like [Belonocnema kinseyi]|uniref:uncharacterized protein K02A2.6-like n=1 Tax=Belonocnema kinseyi TaxID=2817044 RepID=UPI00143D143F|nr:uncharacterized protein K02A2.6-like [Belonocnema kinseyi]